MTRHQVWKARERARFRVISEMARFERLYRVKARNNPKRALAMASEDDRQRLVLSHVAQTVAAVAANQRGIPEPFLG